MSIRQPVVFQVLISAASSNGTTGSESRTSDLSSVVSHHKQESSGDQSFSVSEVSEVKLTLKLDGESPQDEKKDEFDEIT